MKKTLFLICGLLIGLTLQAQHRLVCGYVTAFGDLPVQNIIISSKNAASSALSDSAGFFMIVCSEKDVIKASSETFRTEKIKVNPETDTVRIELKFIPNAGNEARAVALGYMEEDMLSSALQKSTNENDRYCNYRTLAELMSHEFPELAAGMPGGAKSFNMEVKPLYVVDGVQVPNADYLIPCDIMDVTVIKDATTAIYGSRGAGGVVMITTKKGSQ